MTAPLYGVALVVAIIACIIADKVPRWRAIFTMAVLLIFGTVFCALASVITASVPRYVFLCFINTAIWCGNPLALSYTSTVLGLAQPEVRAANLAQLYATEIITVSKPPLAVMGFQVFSGLFAIGAMIYLACFFIYQKWPYKSTQTA
jgi:MFS family permease